MRIERLQTGVRLEKRQRMLGEQLIEELEDAPGDDERRRNYRLTPLGRAVARAEARRLQLVRIAQVRGVLPAPRGARIARR
jgi:hypothetical protein